MFYALALTKPLPYSFQLFVLVSHWSHFRIKTPYRRTKDILICFSSDVHSKTSAPLQAHGWMGPINMKHHRRNDLSLCQSKGIRIASWVVYEQQSLVLQYLCVHKWTCEDGVNNINYRHQLGLPVVAPLRAKDCRPSVVRPVITITQDWLGKSRKSGSQIKMEVWSPKPRKKWMSRREADFGWAWAWSGSTTVGQPCVNRNLDAESKLCCGR